MKSAIETHQLSRRYGAKAAVDGLDLSVPEGSVYAFLGPNGAGKTTTIKMLLNIVRASAGSASVLGTDSTKLGPAELAQIGYVSENQRLPDWMTVQQLVDFCRPMYPTWDNAFCERLLADFELPRDRKLKHLSRGMKMKAALVSSLAYRPRLLVMDEPFSGLDPLVRDELIRGILELTEQERWTVFLSSHDIDEVERLADWVGIVNAGKMQLSEPVESLQRRFRRMEWLVPTSGRLPSTLPKSWVLPETTEHTIRIVETQYEPGTAESRVSALFPEATSLTVNELSLREIFITLARTFRLNTQPPQSR